MIVIDSSALVAILFDESQAQQFIHAIALASGRLMSAVSLQETSMVIASRRPAASPWSRLDAFLLSAQIQVVSHDRDLAIAAREAFLRFGKGRHPAGLNMGDCASYALAKTRDLPLLFKGDDFVRTDITPAV